MTTARALVMAALAVGVASTLAQPTADRERIAQERAAAKARRAEQERTCRDQFVVTACLEAARKEEQATLSRLRRAEVALDDAQRREAAARRRQSIQQHAAERAAAASAGASEAPRRDEPRAAPAPQPALLPRPAVPASGNAAERRAVEQRNEADYAARLRAAQSHRDEVERRNAARTASGKQAAPLPTPGSGASTP